MEQFANFSQTDELMNETVTDAELKEILERIGHEEFGGNPQTTVRDIVEGTSADPTLVARLLGEIRKEEWEKKFGDRIDEHEERIEKLEEERPAPTQQVVIQPVFASGRSNRRREMEEQDEQTKAGLLIALIVVGPLLLYALITWLTSPRQDVIQAPITPTQHWSN